MIRTHECHNLVALVERENSRIDLEHSRQYDPRVEIQPRYNFQLKIISNLNEIVNLSSHYRISKRLTAQALTLSPDHVSEKYLIERKWKEAFRELGLDYEIYKGTHVFPSE